MKRLIFFLSVIAVSLTAQSQNYSAFKVKMENVINAGRAYSEDCTLYGDQSDQAETSKNTLKTAVMQISKTDVDQFAGTYSQDSTELERVSAGKNITNFQCILNQVEGTVYCLLECNGLSPNQSFGPCVAECIRRFSVGINYCNTHYQ